MTCFHSFLLVPNNTALCRSLPLSLSSVSLYAYYTDYSTAKRSDVKMHVLTLLNRHRMVFGAYRWTEFDEDFLIKHVQSVAIVDAERKVKYCDSLPSCTVVLTLPSLSSCLDNVL